MDTKINQYCILRTLKFVKKMKKFLSVLGLMSLAIGFNGCRPDDDASVAPPRDYQTQYNVEAANIENFLKTHRYTGGLGQGSFTNAEFEEVPSEDPQSIWNSPNLRYRMVTQNEVEYKLYYLMLNPGAGAHPCNVDSVLSAYQGLYIYDNIDSQTDDLTPVQFEMNNFPQDLLSLESTIRGWGEIMPQFGTAGSVTNVPGEPQSYEDFGAGIMFIPSGLGYYNVYTGTIPSYSTLIFKFKLYALERADQDGDGIPSWLEDVEPEPGVTDPQDPMAARYMYYYSDQVTDDTDGDGIPDYRDVDDDGDNILTRVETRIPGTEVDGVWQHYPFIGIEDDPLTPENEEVRGIPSCGGDFFTPTRLRKHLDATACP